MTEADYAVVTERHPGVQRAVATFRWTGSWHTVFITVDRMGGLPVERKFKEQIRQSRRALSGWPATISKWMARGSFRWKSKCMCVRNRTISART